MTDSTPVAWSYVDDEASFDRALATLAGGSGPVGIDVERASGYRYFQSAYLLQIFRNDSGVFLIDPTKIDSFQSLQTIIGPEEWILHSAVSDLPSLTELGLKPERLFDTEVASRLLNLPRVGLGHITESLLGIKLEKAHSRADWSIRPLPEPWLVYAALDVVYLPALRDSIYRQLVATGKDRIANEEFEFILRGGGNVGHKDPWMRIPGIGRVRTGTGMKILENLWNARDKMARELDLAPNRILPNSSIIEVAATPPRSAGELAKNKKFIGRYSRTHLNLWWRAVLNAKKDPESDSKIVTSRSAIPKSIKQWERVNPEAYDRLQMLRQTLEAEAKRLSIPQENLIPPAIVKALAWDPPANLSEEKISGVLSSMGARNWQTELLSHIFTQNFVELLQNRNN